MCTDKVHVFGMCPFFLDFGTRSKPAELVVGYVSSLALNQNKERFIQVVATRLA